MPTWPFSLDQQRAEPFRSPVDGRRQAGRPSANDHQIVERHLRPGPQPDLGREFLGGGLGEMRSIREDNDWERGGVSLRQLGHALRLGALLDVEPLIGVLVARQKVLDLMARCRPAVPQDTDALERRVEGRPPVVEQVGDHRVQMFLGWVPGLQQVMVQVDLVDGADGHAGIGVSGEQHSFGFREQVRCGG